MSTTIEESRRSGRRVGDSVFSGLALGAALVILVALAGVAIFLVLEGLPGLTAPEENLGGASSSGGSCGPWSSAPCWRR